MKTVKDKTGVDLFEGEERESGVRERKGGESEKIYIIPPDRIRYLAEIAESSGLYRLGERAM
jgi:methylmalonyl-CoA mutase